MLAHLNDKQTAWLIALTIVALTFIIVQVIDALNARGIRFHERFMKFRTSDDDNPGATPAADTIDDDVFEDGLGLKAKPKPLNVEGLGHAIVRDTPAFGGNYRPEETARRVFPSPRPIRDNPQA